jgi:hypothetical protein
MKRCIHLVLSFIVVIITLFSAAAVADECLHSSRKLNENAQTIRLKAMDMGWPAGKTASLTTVTVASGKSGIYPKDNVEICLREKNDTLQIADI